MRIQRIRVQNFRCLADVDIRLRPFTVIVGPNGVGKSSLLEIAQVLSKVHREGISNPISSFGGFRAALRYNSPEPSMELGIDVVDEDVRFAYGMKLREEAQTFFVQEESLTLQEPPQPSPTKRNVKLIRRNDAQCTWFRADESASLSADAGHGSNLWITHANRVERGDAFCSGLERTSSWPVHQFRLDQRTRGPQQLQQANLPSTDGSNLLSVLYTLRTESHDTFSDLMEAMRQAVPEFKEIDFPLAGAGHVSMAWRQSNLSRPLFQNQLSDGTLRFLWLMTILHSVPDDGLVMIDEPELSLHPQWILLAVSVMRKMSARTNIVVATQSTEFLRWIERDELLIADMTEEGAKFSWASDRPDIDDWLKDFSLSELWTMGELGGRR